MSRENSGQRRRDVFTGDFGVWRKLDQGDMMDGLPGELCLKIFHLLDHQSLASAPQGQKASPKFLHCRLAVWVWQSIASVLKSRKS